MINWGMLIFALFLSLFLSLFFELIEKVYKYVRNKKRK